jgi:nitrite reductase (NO-forming)
MNVGRSRGRVVESHKIAASAFRLAGAFGLVGAVWSLIIAIGGGSWWGPLHTFLAGSVLLAIAGATQLFTITWSASPAPRAPLPTIQRWATGSGLVLVLVGVTADVGALVVAGTGALLGGVGLLGALLVGSVRRSLLRRFDLSARFYLLALGCGAIGITLGALMAAAASSDSRLRLVHSHLNLVGLIGFTIVGTLPTILATFAHHRVVSGTEARVAWWLCVAAAALITGGLFVPSLVGAGTLVAALAAVLILAGVIVRLRRKSFKGGLPYYQATIGTAWLIAWGTVEGFEVLTTSVATPFPPWTGVVVLSGIGQVLLGSLAYLLPVLAGPHPRLGPNSKRMTRHGWLPLALANGSAIALLAGFGVPAAVGYGIWVLDFGRRALTLDRRKVAQDNSLPVDLDG